MTDISNEVLTNQYTIDAINTISGMISYCRNIGFDMGKYQKALDDIQATYCKKCSRYPENSIFIDTFRNEENRSLFTLKLDLAIYDDIIFLYKCKSPFAASTTTLERLKSLLPKIETILTTVQENKEISSTINSKCQQLGYYFLIESMLEEAKENNFEKVDSHIQDINYNANLKESLLEFAEKYHIVIVKDEYIDLKDIIEKIVKKRNLSPAKKNIKVEVEETPPMTYYFPQEVAMFIPTIKQVNNLGPFQDERIRRCGPSDFARRIVPYKYDTSGLTSEGKHAGQWWLNSFGFHSKKKLFSFINSYGSLSTMDLSHNDYSESLVVSIYLRPCVNYSAIENYCSPITVNSAGFSEIQFGEFPQELLCAYNNVKEWSRINENKVRIGKKKYNYTEYPIYSYKDKYFICIDSIDMEHPYDDSPGCDFIAISPISWIVSKKDNFAITKSLLTNITRMYDNIYSDIFTKKGLKADLNNFANEIIGSIEITGQEKAIEKVLK